MLIAKARRTKREGEAVCNCKAYKFPHRMFGGRCEGIEVVEEAFGGGYGSENCANCNCFRGDTVECEVLEGIENVSEARCVDDFIRWNEVKIYKGDSR